MHLEYLLWYIISNVYMHAYMMHTHIYMNIYICDYIYISKYLELPPLEVVVGHGTTILPSGLSGYGHLSGAQPAASLDKHLNLSGEVSLWERHHIPAANIHLTSSAHIWPLSKNLCKKPSLVIKIAGMEPLALDQAAMAASPSSAATWMA